MSQHTPLLGDPAPTRELAMLRELFREHYDLADRFEAAAQQISVVERSLHSTEGQQGVAELLLDAADQCRAAAGTLGNLNLDALAYSVATLNQLVTQVPERLLKTADDVQFRAALSSAIANEVTDAVVIAREQAIEFGVDLAVEGVAAAVTREIDKIQLHDLFTKQRLQGELNRYKKAYAELDGSFAAEREKHARLYADKLADASRWGVRRMVAALILGVVIGLAHLAPMIEEKLHPDLMLKPAQLRIPRHSDTQPTLIRTPVPRSFGQAVGAQRRRAGIVSLRCPASSISSPVCASIRP